MSNERCGHWWGVSRQLTGQPYRYHGYAVRTCHCVASTETVKCHDGYHRSGKAARVCGNRRALALIRAEAPSDEQEQT